MGKIIKANFQPNSFDAKKLAEEAEKQKHQKDLEKFVKKFGGKVEYNKKEVGTPLLVLRCIETYSDAPTNREFFTKDYAYHIIKVKSHKGHASLIMQTNFTDLEAEIPMEVIHQIFAGFGKQNSKDIKIIK